MELISVSTFQDALDGLEQLGGEGIEVDPAVA
jgi:hypothetical protein